MNAALITLLKDLLLEDIKLNLQAAILRFEKDYVKDKNALVNDPEDIVFTYLQEIRFQIDEKTETEVKVIYDRRDEMLDKLAKYETECRKKAKQIAKSADLETKFKEFEFLKKQVELPEFNCVEIYEKINKLESDLYQYKGDLFQNKRCTFITTNFCSVSRSELAIRDLPALSSSDRCDFKDFLASLEKTALIYAGSRDGLSADVFHSKCDGKEKTFTIIEAKETGYVFGGYTDLAWDSSNTCKKDPNAFIFSLTNKENKPALLRYRTDKYSIECKKGAGPIFGTAVSVAAFGLGNTGFQDDNFTIHFNNENAKTYLSGNKGRFNTHINEIAVFQLNSD